MPPSASPKRRSISPKNSQASGSAKKTVKKEVPATGGDIRNFVGFWHSVVDQSSFGDPVSSLKVLLE